MKRFISIVLAFALCISVLGGMSIAGAEDAATERTYTLGLNSVDKTIEGVWDSSLKTGSLQSSIIPLTGYGTHGFKFWAADSDSYAAQSTSAGVRTLQFQAASLRMYGRYNLVPHLASKDGVRVAIAFEKPSTVPSFYTVTTSRTSSGTETNSAKLYTSPLVETEKNIAYYQTEAAQNGTVYSWGTGSSIITHPELIYNNGTDDHVISFYTGYGMKGEMGDNVEMASITLKPVEATGIALNLTEAYVLTGETKSIKTYAILDNKSQGFITDSYVTYKSSDDNIASVSATGVITGKKAGTATITATVGSFSATATIVVGKHNYSFAKPSTTSEIWDSTVAAGKNMKESIVPLKGFGTHGYKYWDADDASITNQAVNVRTLHYYAGGLRVWSYGDNSAAETFANPNGAKLALVFKTPRKGFYEVSHKKGASDGNYTHEIYIEPITAEEEAVANRPQAESYMKPESLAKQGTDGSTGSYKYDRIIALDGVDNFIWTISITPKSRFSMIDFTLTEMEVAAIELKADATELEIGGKANLTATANDKAIAHSFVTYENLNPTVVKVEEDGTVTALATGEATIKATANGLSDTVKITVAEPAPELPGEAADETVNVYVAAENGGSIVSGDITIGSVNEVAIGKSITVKAEDDEVLRFSHWRNAAGKFVSENKTYTFKANTNTSLVAVFDKPEGDDGNFASVLLYNENKTFIDQYYIEKGKPFSLISVVAWPQMTGHVFREWSIPDDTIINSLTRAVAFFDVKDEVYNAKFYDSNDTTPDYTGSGKYGEEVSYTATGENFSHWEMADGSVVSYDKTMKLRLWADIELKAVYADEVKPVPTIILDEEDGAYFIAYSVPAGYEKVAAGIVFANSGTPTVNNCFSRATAERTDATGQFTATPNESESVARGYLMFKKDGEIRVIYAD